MRRWFTRLGIHGKLVALALLVTAVALAVAVTFFAAFDFWQYRSTAQRDARDLASLLAEHAAPAVMFTDATAAGETLRSVRVRDVIRKACIYLPDGRRYTGFSRDPAHACPDMRPASAGFGILTGAAPITREGRTYGTLYVERDSSDLISRLLLTMVLGLGTLVLGGAAALAAANRLHGTISEPIATLSRFARGFATGDAAAIEPPARTSPDEVGDLAEALADMVARIRLDLRLKDEFLAAVSHELRTPLNAMMGWARILSTTQPGEEAMRRAVASILKNAHAQARVIADLIDVSSIVAGKMRLQRAAVHMGGVVSNALEAIQPEASAKAVRLESRSDAGPHVVCGDAVRLQQVLWNLLSNAVKFTPAGGAIVVTLARAGDAVTVEVRDSGIGIPADFLPYVFDRFRQADGSPTRAHGGLGLGLAIVKELTELHGGSVSVQSAGANRGAAFTVRLPAAGGEVPVSGEAAYADRRVATGIP